ncbi:MAG: YqhA family protein [Arcobacteraceae bacterium]
MFEKIFENGLWKSRFIVILAVIFSFLGAVILFLTASVDIIHVAQFVINSVLSGTHPEHFHEDIVAGIIGAVDLYLIAIVMLIFSFGVYELFISKIDAACNDEDENCSTILSITSLDQLKDKIAKVIIMVLIVNYFQRVLHTTYETPLELLYFALAITALAVGLYFLGKVGKK